MTMFSTQIISFAKHANVLGKQLVKRECFFVCHFELFWNTILVNTCSFCSVFPNVI